MSFKSADRISQFIECKIGLKRGDVFLEPHNTEWKQIFWEESNFIIGELKNESLRLHHMGSTSVEGLDAKPIIDILGSVESLEDLDSQKSILEGIGYDCKGEYGIKGRRYCVLYNPEKTVAYVHLHIFQDDDHELEKHLNFRDQLRRSEVDRLAYQACKRKIIEDLKIPRSKYSEAKNEIISKIQKKANSV